MAKHPRTWLVRAGKNATFATVGHADETLIERGIKMRRQQQAVEDVEPFGVRSASGPRLDVAGA
jgi:hypothetical protein